MTKDERRDKRIPVGLKVRFKSATIAEFIEHYSRDLSRGGIFIRTDSPMPIGTLIKFDICLNDEKSLIQGVGRVVWRRDENVSEEAPAGMGIKFIKLDESSRGNLDLMMGESQPGEGKPPGEPPIIVETQGETVDDGGPPQPIAPVRPQAMPKGAKRTMIGMGPGPRGESASPETKSSADEDAGAEAKEESAGAAAEAPNGGNFLADISSAIDTALGSSDSSPAVEAATEAAAPTAEAEEKAEEEAAAAPAEVEKKEAPEEAEKKEAPVVAAAAAATEPAPTKAEVKETPKPAEPRKEAKPAEKHAEPAAVRIGADTKERRGVPPIVWLLLLAGAAGAIYYFGFYTPEQEGTGEVAQGDATAEPAKPEPAKPEPVKPEPVKPEPVKPMAKIEIATTPAGASVTIDGAARDGVTPLAVDGLTPQKEITIEARLFGYAPLAQKAVPGEGEPLKVEMKLAPAKVDLEFKSTPPGAGVKSGDKWLCKTPKVISQKGMTSDLAYTISKPGYQDVSGSVSQSDFSFVDGAYKALVEVALVAVEKPVEKPKVETPKVETPKVETPKVETPKEEKPKVETPKEEKPKEEKPKVEPPKKTGDIEEDPYG